MQHANLPDTFTSSCSEEFIVAAWCFASCQTEKNLCTMPTGYYVIAIQFDLNPMISASSRHYCSIWVRFRVGVPSDAETNYAFAPSPQSPPPSFFVKYPKSGRLETQQQHTCSALPQLPSNIFLFLRWEDTSIHQSCQVSGPLGAGALCGTRLISLLWLAWFGTNTPRLPSFLLLRCVRLCALYRNKELWDFRNSAMCSLLHGL